MIDILINNLSSNLDKITSISMLILGGLYFRFLLQAFGQAWIKTKAHTATLLILPIITYIITNVISGNIALSLGMVGALSIVRFRNPVRSPLELSTYFAAITMGISASVSLLWFTFLIASISLAIFVMVLLDFLGKSLFKQPLFIASFSEGNNLSVLTIELPKTIDICEKNILLQSKLTTENRVTYSFASPNFSDLKELESNDEIQSKALNIELRR